MLQLYFASQRADWEAGKRASEKERERKVKGKGQQCCVSTQKVIATFLDRQNRTALVGRPENTKVGKSKLSNQKIEILEETLHVTMGVCFYRPVCVSVCLCVYLSACVCV